MRTLLAFILIALGGVVGLAQSPKSHLKVGDKAPEFELPNGDGTPVKLSDYIQSGPVVLVFYRGYW